MNEPFCPQKTAEERIVRAGVATAASSGVAFRTGSGWERELGFAGHLDRKRQVPVERATPFDLASVTKPVVAVCLARLCRRGALCWDAPLARYLPEIADTASADVPLELFVAHRAGLEPHRTLFAPLLAGRAISRRGALREAANARRPDAIGPAPADGFAPLYSDLGYLLVGEAMSRALGTELDELIWQEVVKPLALDLGSARQWSKRQPSFVRRVAATEAIGWRGGTVRGVVHDENAWAIAGHGAAGHAGLFGSAESLLTFGTAVLDALAGRQPGFLAQDEAERLIRPRPAGTLRAGFDGVSGLESAAGRRAGSRTFGHLGFTGTSLWCDPEREAVTVLLTNRVHPTRDHLGIRAARPLVQDDLWDWAAWKRSPRAIPSP